MRKSVVVLKAFLVAVLAFGAIRAAQATPPELEEEAQTALKALYARSPGAEALGAKAKAILVFPNVRKVAAIVGAQGGHGVMLKDGKPTTEYRLTGLQLGLEVGGQAFSYAMFLMSESALEKLRSSKGFEIGADPNIVFVDAGAGVQMTTTSTQADVYTYVYGQKGMMAGISLQGTKISRVGD